MRFVVVVLAIGLIPTWTAPASAQNYGIEKVREIPIDLGDEIVGQISDLARDAAGNFYLPDWQQHTVWVTDPSGKMIRRIGQEGSGPGEMSRPQNVTVFDDRIVVLDKDNFRVATFDLNGAYQGSFRVELFRPADMVGDGDGRIAVSTLEGESLFTVYDSNGNRTHEAGSRPWPPDGPPIMFGGSFQHTSSTPEGRVLYSSITTYEVFDIEWDGRIVAKYTAEPQGYLPMVIASMDFSGDKMNKTSAVMRPLVVGDHVLIQRSRIGPENTGILHLDLFERDGTLVQMDIESPLSFIYADGDDLYAIDTSPVEEGELNPSIVVYQLRN
ncbi:MAG: 6-bladed beta-propeller [Gemmatimonadota bacterium]|nr:6-bladed beta-propeller [Gemmatimonadota bacterium]